jgi:tetratricopeptide (TPR) repeat protein
VLLVIDTWQEKINNLKTWHVAWVIALVGLVVYCSGLNGGFQGDDTFQIVTNTPVHSIANIAQFFRSSTFYNGSQLTGVYYRPLMTTVFSAIYTLFGPTPMVYHLVQLIFYLSGGFILYLLFRHFLSVSIALPLILIFVAHPLNSQNVFAIPSMQDALFFLFGTLALWVLIHYQSTRSLLVVAACLLLSLLAKEAAIVFVLMAFIYLYLFDRQRLTRFLYVMILPTALYVALKANAVGLVGMNPKAGPIDNLNLPQRLFTVPSLIQFYVEKFIFPNQLANNYYWTYPNFSFTHVLMPLLAEVALLGLFIYGGFRIYKQLSKNQFFAYLFFMTWAVLGLGLYLQVLPLDMTACEGWFYLSMAGLLGAIGVIAQTIHVRQLQLSVVAVSLVFTIGALGVQTALRGTNYYSQYTLAMHDIRVSKDDYFAMNNLAQNLIDQGKFVDAAAYARQSAAIFPAVGNYDNLGVALEKAGNYQGAMHAYRQALKYGDMSIVYENLSLLNMVYSDPITAGQFFQKAIKAYLHDYKLWVYLAIYEGAEGSTSNAKVAIANAAKYGSIPPMLYSNIMNDKPFLLSLIGKTLLVR